MFPRASSNFKNLDLKFSEGCEEVAVEESNSESNVSLSECDDVEEKSAVIAALRKKYSL